MLLPFDASITWPREFEGQALPTYISWMMVACVISLLDAPAICLPCGVSASGLPIGVQLVVAPRCQAFLMQVAAAYERAHNHHSKVPVACIPGATEAVGAARAEVCGSGSGGGGSSGGDDSAGGAAAVS